VLHAYIMHILSYTKLATIKCVTHSYKRFRLNIYSFDIVQVEYYGMVTVITQLYQFCEFCTQDQYHIAFNVHKLRQL